MKRKRITRWSSDWRTEPDECAGRTVSRAIHVRLALALLTFTVVVLAARSTRAEERGAIGGDLHASFGFYYVGAPRAGASLWYRLTPALALGLSGDGMFVDSGANAHRNPKRTLQSGVFVQAFADGRLFPDSWVGLFARLSAGLGDASVASGESPAGPVALLDAEAGPELRVFLTGPRAHRPALLFRPRAGVTWVGIGNQFVNLGLSLGFEG